MAVLIKNGIVYDGTGHEPVKQDILIQGKRIIRIGSIQRSAGDKIIDASSLVVTPGFIDIHSHIDHSSLIFSDPHLQSFIEQGITSVMMGNCGYSAAPFFGAEHSDSLRVDWFEGSHPNIGWKTVKDFLSYIKKRKSGINIGTLVGYTAIRRFILKDAFRDLSDSEVSFAKKVVEDGIEDGAFGFSVGLSNKSERWTSFFEMKELAGVVKKYNSVFAMHVRDTRDEVYDGVMEGLKLAEETGVSLEISHLHPFLEHARVCNRARGAIEHSAPNANVHFDISPVPLAGVPISYFFPDWAISENRRESIKVLSATAERKRILSHFKNLDADKIIIASVPPPFEFLVGKTLASYAGSLDTTPVKALIKLAEITNLNAVCVYEGIDKISHRAFLSSPKSIIASHGANFSKEREMSKKFQYFLQKFLKLSNEDTGFLSLGRVIEKMTSIPARKYGISHRGFLKEGFYADIVILRDFSPFYVFINGSLAMEEGKMAGVLAGHALKRKNA